jgi:hypothetical protein
MSTTKRNSIEQERIAFMKRNTEPQRPQVWSTPELTYRGTVGEILKGGGGKVSIQLADSGEKRCEKPHTTDCTPF